MADDELLVKIDKAFWPKGVMRGLTPVLRELGDKHGNLVIAAQQAKGVIMVKGTAAQIEAVKPGLKDVIEEHFPDAPLPEELEEGAGVAASEPPPPAPEPPAKPEAPPKAKAPAPAAKANVPPTPAKAKEVSPAQAEAPRTGIMGRLAKALKGATSTKEGSEAGGAASSVMEIRGPKRPRPSTHSSPDLLWECMKNSSSFIRRPSKTSRTFSAEPQNLLALHSQKYCGLAAVQALDVRPTRRGSKEAIQLSQSCAKPAGSRRPSSAVLTTGLSKCPRRGMKSLNMQLGAKFYRTDLLEQAQIKYMKAQQSFRKRRPKVRSRRAQKK